MSEKHRRCPRFGCSRKWPLLTAPVVIFRSNLPVSPLFLDDNTFCDLLHVVCIAFFVIFVCVNSYKKCMTRIRMTEKITFSCFSCSDHEHFVTNNETDCGCCQRVIDRTPRFSRRYRHRWAFTEMTDHLHKYIIIIIIKLICANYRFSKLLCFISITQV